jgi:exopolysaccharide production protein ExoZ
MRTYTGIQAMRGIAALSVVCGHAVTMRQAMGIPWPLALNALGFLQSGVDVFFVISGFIITNTGAEIGKSRGRLGAFEFSLKRAGRIFPAYWLVLTAAVLSSYWIDIFPGIPDLHVGYENIFALSTSNWFVPPAWSICFELYFYAFVAAVILVAPKYVMELMVVAVCLLLVNDIKGAPFSPIYSYPLTLEFGLGVGIAYLVKLGFHPSWPRTLGLLALLLFAAGAYLISGGGQFAGFERVMTYGFGSALLIYAVIAGELNGATFPRWLQYLGAISYSLYISHHLLLTWLAKYNPAWLFGPLQILIWIALAILLAAALYEFFERPILARLRIAMPKPPMRPAVVSSPAAAPAL